jgi:hypothetical protein
MTGPSRIYKSKVIRKNLKNQRRTSAPSKVLWHLMANLTEETRIDYRHQNTTLLIPSRVKEKRVKTSPNISRCASLAGKHDSTVISCRKPCARGGIHRKSIQG